jgi:thiol oxidase
MTANAQTEADGLHTLHVIRDYVNVFFGCRACAGHFVKMARYMDTEAMLLEQGRMNAALWLWQAHNTVTRRLLRDGSLFSDPLHPKLVWPNAVDVPGCPDCHEEGLPMRAAVQHLLACYGAHRDPAGVLLVPLGVETSHGEVAAAAEASPFVAAGARRARHRVDPELVALALLVAATAVALRWRNLRHASCRLLQHLLAPSLKLH